MQKTIHTVFVFIFFYKKGINKSKKQVKLLSSLWACILTVFVNNIGFAQFTKTVQNLSGTTITTITPNTSFKYHIQINCASLTVSCGSATFTDVLASNLNYIGNSASSAGLTANYNSSTRTLTVSGMNDGSTYDFDIIVGIGNLYNGTVINNSATITDGSNVRTTPVVSVTVTGGNDPPSFWNGISGWKSAPPQGSPNNTISYNIGIGNPSASTYTNYRVEDIFPTNFLFEYISTPTWEGTNVNFTVFYRNAAGVWVNWFTANSNVNQWRSVYDLGLNAGDIKGIRLVFATMPGGGSFALNRQALGIQGRVQSTATLGSWFTNCATFTATNSSNGANYSQQYCDSTRVQTVVAPVVMGKLRNPSLPGYLPGDTIPFTLYFGTAENASGAFVNPQIMDILPPELEFVNTVSIQDEGGNFYATSGPFSHNFTQTAISGGRTRLKWDFTNMTIPKGWYVFKINFKARVKTGVATGTYTNYQYVNSTANNATHCYQYDPWDEPATITDASDLDGDGNTTETFCSSSNQFQVIFPSGAGLETFKWVKGTLDADYNRYPLSGSTVRGGISDYKLVIKNPGTVPMTSIKVIDILPFVGDKGVVLSTTDRLSQWQPYLVNQITAPAGVTVYYSTVSNPCRPELNITVAGCTSPSWTTSPPADITTVRSLKFELGAITLNPNDSVIISWPMRAPTTAPTGGEIAWNSFGYIATRTDNNVTLLASEPRKVGISVQQESPADYGDKVWLDANANGIQDASETTGVSGVKVELYRDDGDNTPEPTTGDTYIGFTMSGNDGTYLFPNLPAGNYFAVFSNIPAGYTVSPANVHSNTLETTDSDGTSIGGGKWVTVVTNLTAMEEDRTWDLGLYNSITCPSSAAAGSNQTHCTNIFTMAATTPSVGIGTWSVVNGTATITDIYSPTTSVTVISSTATLRWTVTAGACPAVYSDVILTITPQISITTQPQNILECLGGTSALSVNITGGVGNTYQWQSSTDNSSFSNITGETSSSYTPPNTAIGTRYYRVILSSSGNGCNSTNSNSASVQVVADPSVSVTVSVPTICQGGSTVLTANMTDNSASCSLQWQSSSNGVTWSNIVGETGTSYTTPALSSTLRYKVVLICSGSGCCN